MRNPFRRQIAGTPVGGQFAGNLQDEDDIHPEPPPPGMRRDYGILRAEPQLAVELNRQADIHNAGRTYWDRPYPTGASQVYRFWENVRIPDDEVVYASIEFVPQ